ncbi:MAG: ribbon-helix-helix domain-containing protein [Desulfurococcales archaeon]|nr:ribbon-helix-helix domain-containing protein [Desulfurococcales archaeon]MEB3789848.1 ribbon-helix-helix domain-containing protein [Desulfurococcales archaeon]
MQITHLVLVSPEQTLYERLRVVTFKITPSELEQVDKLARKMGMSRSELIRYALNKILEELEANRQPK